MKKVTIDSLKATVTALGYKWFEDRPNIIGLRTNIVVSNLFNDYIFVAYNNILSCWIITTEPGVDALVTPMNPLGAAVLKPGQYVDSWELGFHKQRPDHKALIQVKPITVYRDNDKDGIAEVTTTETTGLYGVNIHGTKVGRDRNDIGAFSAGCQVFRNWKDKEELMKICESAKTITKNKFTYTLLTEDQLL